MTEKDLDFLIEAATRVHRIKIAHELKSIKSMINKYKIPIRVVIKLELKP